MKCQNGCGREATVDFGESRFGLGERWCQVCVLEAEIEHAEERAARLPELRRRLEALLAAERQEA